jgi:hypothetical protein
MFLGMTAMSDVLQFSLWRPGVGLPGIPLILLFLQYTAYLLVKGKAVPVTGREGP